MKKHSSFSFRFLSSALFFFLLAFALPALKDGNSVLFLLAVAVPGIILLFTLILGRLFSLDLPSVSIVLVLCAFSVMASAPLDPDKALSQALYCAAGLLFLIAGTVFLRVYRPSFSSALILALLSLLFLSSSLWIPALSFSLVTFGQMILLLTVCTFLALRARLPALITVLAGCSVLLIQHDWISSLVCGICFVLVFWSCSGSSLWSVLSLLSSGLLFAGFQLFSPGSPSVSAESCLTRLSAMNWFSQIPQPEEISGLLPYSPGILSLGDQYGLILLLIIVLLFVLLLFRCSSIAQCTRKLFHASVASGGMLILGLDALAFFCSVLGILSLPAGDLPFFTDSLPDLGGQMFLIGLISGVSARNRADLSEDTHLAMLAR